MKRFISLLFVVLTASATMAQRASSVAPVRITLKPNGLVHGSLPVSVTVSPETTRVAMSINGVPYAEQRNLRSMVFPVNVGKYLRRLRIQVTGYDALNQITGEDEMVVNDPQPPFRVKLSGRDVTPEQTVADLSASVIAPEGTRVEGVDFYYGETHVGTDVTPPYGVQFNPSSLQPASYARVLARGSGNSEANDVYFFGAAARENVDVFLQRIPVSVVGKHELALSKETIRLSDNGSPAHIETVLRASDQPLNVILLMDSSESMLEELPTLKYAAKQFARSVLGKGDRIAVVGFHQRTFWLTPFTNDLATVEKAVDRLRPSGQTHLYDSIIEMLFELQKQEGRRALVVLSDGANQGGDFTLDHLVHYAKYSGVPVYPVIKNTMLAKLMRFGVGYVQVQRVKEIARDTGARYFIINKPNELTKVYREIADELRRQYTILFYPADVTRDRWHTLQVTSTTGAQLRAPKGFFP